MPLSTRSEKIITEEECIRLEHEPDIRHEFISGKLIDMPGESDLHNLIAGKLFVLFSLLLKSTAFNIHFESVKVKIPGEAKYYYPDIFITRKTVGQEKKFIKHFPEIIIEVLPESTRKYDTVDKFINYRKFETLKYYLLVEPEKEYVSVFTRLPHNEWDLTAFTSKADVINLSKFSVSFSLKDVYE